jgi:hypothetical protein
MFHPSLYISPSINQLGEAPRDNSMRRPEAVRLFFNTKDTKNTKALRGSLAEGCPVIAVDHFAPSPRDHQMLRVLRVLRVEMEPRSRRT